MLYPLFHLSILPMIFFFFILTTWFQIDQMTKAEFTSLLPGQQCIA